MMPAQCPRTRALLESLYRDYHDPRWLERDPLRFAHRYGDAPDREVAALVAASFAFGNVAAINATVERVLGPLGERPARRLAELEERDLGRLYRGFVYRWIRAGDVRLYLFWIGEALRAHGTLGASWQAVDSNPVEDICLPLGRWVDRLRASQPSRLRVRRRLLERATGGTSVLPTGAHMLLTSPGGGSGCKRMHLFLRWVCRPEDGVDLGLWGVSPARLLMPVDTHILQVARRLGWTGRVVADARTAREITAALAAYDPADPCRFDFCLTRPGILKRPELLEGIPGAR